MLLFLLLCPALAQGTKPHPPSLIIILLPGTSLTNWQRAHAPHLHTLMAQGAVAVMNTRTARTGSDKARETPVSALLTLGSGARAAGDDAQGQFVPPGQIVLPGGVTAAQLYQRRMGAAPSASDWVNPNWPRVLRANQGRGYDVHLGNLGDALTARGVDVRAGGQRFALPLACTGAGTACVSPALSLPPSGPACLVWDAGSDIADADRVLADAMHLEASTGGRVLVVSPLASDADYARGERLTPIALWGANVMPGLLYSRSTRRAGLVTDTDFAPAVAEFFGATLPALPFGQAWTAQPSPHAEAQVMRLQKEAYGQAAGMRMLPAFAVVLGLGVLGCSIALYLGRGLPALALFPLVSLAALLFSGSVRECALWLAALGVGAIVLTRFVGAARAGTSVCALIVGVMTVDLLCGDPLMRRNLLGYSAIEGARYYGIGNEAMGVLIGAALCLAWRVWPVVKQSWGRWGIAAGLTGLAGLLALPAFGAKAGSVFVAVPAFGALLWQMSEKRMGRQPILILAALAVLAMTGIVLLDRHSGGGQSHIGQAAARIAQGGAREAWDIAARKLGMEGHLLTHSAWAALLWGGAVGLALVMKQRSGNKHSSALLLSGAVAAVTSLAFNDAGTVACALCLSIIWSTAALQQNK